MYTYYIYSPIWMPITMFVRTGCIFGAVSSLQFPTLEPWATLGPWARIRAPANLEPPEPLVTPLTPLDPGTPLDPLNLMGI